MRSFLLVSLIAAGAAGLLVGPAAIAAALRNRRDTPPVRAYLVAVTVLTATAATLVALNHELWPFLLLALATEAAVLGGHRATRRPPRAPGRRLLRVAGHCAPGRQLGLDRRLGAANRGGDPAGRAGRGC